MPRVTHTLPRTSYQLNKSETQLLRTKRTKRNSCSSHFSGSGGLPTSSETREIWRNLTKRDAVCMDVDSTVIQDEGIDCLARFCNVGKKVEEWTLKAMGGGVTFRVALKERLNIIRPTITQVRAFIDTYPPLLTPGVRELVRALHRRGVMVFLVSGGFRTLIEPAATQLGIPSNHVVANELLFTADGRYWGFDESQPTSMSGGKGEAIRMIREIYNHNRVVMIGDGATDLEACPPADAFIGFGGNIVRERVRKEAAWYVDDFRTLTDALQDKPRRIDSVSSSDDDLGMAECAISDSSSLNAFSSEADDR